MNYFSYLVEDLSQDEIKELLGVGDEHLKLLSILYNCDISFRNDEFKLYSENINLFNNFKNNMDYLVSKIKEKEVIDDNYLKHAYYLFNSDDHYDLNWQSFVAGYTYGGKPIKCKTYHQYLMFNSAKDNDITFSIGPAGTGKTYVAVYMAVLALKRGEVKKIVLTRPAVEAGESLGFLPGDLKEKVNPYLMPLFDALNDVLGAEQTLKLIEKNIIEVIPLAYMRGRTLQESYVILDEAQNTTANQMLMFLTRLGFKSKMIVNGDITQVDLNINKKANGLSLAMEKLQDIKGINFITFDNKDIVRNPLVQKIIERF